MSLCRVHVNDDVIGIFPIVFKFADNVCDGLLAGLELAVLAQTDADASDVLVGDLADGRGVRSCDRTARQG